VYALPSTGLPADRENTTVQTRRLVVIGLCAFTIDDHGRAQQWAQLPYLRGMMTGLGFFFMPLFAIGVGGQALRDAASGGTPFDVLSA